MPPNIGQPFVPRIHLFGKFVFVGLTVKAGVDHEASVGCYGDLDDEGDASVGEGADSHAVEGDREFGFGGYFAEVGVDEDAAGN